ncbi:putative Aldolase [metagenome]|uniref:Putative Aldolase n=1 Tax=metagenome TaxID=256318 RepID=A0A2P2C925_9ZZZZ
MIDENKPLNRLAALLAGGGVATSLVIRSSRGVEIVAQAAASGFDSLYVDLEHAPLSMSETGAICVAARLSGVTPLVRVPEGRLDLIGTVLDGGAQGVIVPHISSAADAREAVTCARFPPHGHRSVAGPAIQLGYRPLPLAEATHLLNDATMVVAMIESRAAIDAVEEIAAVEGIDMMLVGSNDLLADLGHVGEYDHPDLEAAFDRVLAAGARHGVPVGVGGLAARPDLACRQVRSGARYVSVGTDTALLMRGAKAALADLALEALGGGAHD